MLTVLLVRFGCSVGIGTTQAENHPKLNWQLCSRKGSCSLQSGGLVLDSNWRWIHDVNGKNCNDNGLWNPTLCPDGKTCSDNCLLDGADYSGTYGVTTNGTAATLKFVTHGATTTNVGSRLFLLQDSKTYYLFNLNNKEFTFSVDVSKLPCGLNGALYFVEMDADGGASKYAGAKPGAEYGLGYCNAQCPSDIKFINGEANIDRATGKTGPVLYGNCCAEMDVWQANSQATVFATHLCNSTGQTRCSRPEGCGPTAGPCDQDGCDFNSWRMGNKEFFGPLLDVDTKQPFSVVTQFYGSPVTEIRRKYIQSGKVIENAKAKIVGVDPTGAISDAFCEQQKKAFGDTNDFKKKGGFAKLGEVFSRGVVLVLSIWDDHETSMLWLDARYPTNKPGNQPGVERGPCSTSSGKPADIEMSAPEAYVVFNDIRFGAFNSTY